MNQACSCLADQGDRIFNLKSRGSRDLKTNKSYLVKAVVLHVKSRANCVIHMINTPSAKKALHNNV